MKVLSHNSRYLLAVSGGADSMAMLDMFCKYLPSLNFDVLTIDHQLRPSSQSECQLVKDYCTKYGVNAFVERIDVAGYCKQHSVSVETGASLMRKQLFSKYLDSGHYDYVCLAHNKDDNAESILMHILRGSGLKGAEGIRVVQGAIFRPVLQYTKSQLESYCKENNVPFVLDESNNDVTYRRNFIRHKVMPLLKEFNSGVVDNLVRFGQNVATDNKLLNDITDISSVEFVDGKAIVPCCLLSDKAMSYRVLSKVFVKLGYMYDIEAKHYQDIFELSQSNSGKKINLPFGLIASKQYDNVIISKVNCASVTQSYCYPFAVGKISTPYGTVNISLAKPQDDANIIGRLLYCDRQKLDSYDNLVIRSFEKGDTFSKFGGGTKTLNRYFTDKKLPQDIRKTIPLIASGNKILAVCGVEITKDLSVEQGFDRYYIYITKES